MISSPLFLAILLVLAYGLGSIPSAVIVCRIMRLPDPRTLGSGNPGTTNVLRIGGKQAAVATLLGDALKGTIAVVLAYLAGLNMMLAAWVLFAAFLGHLFPIFARFQGGKGVATLLGGLLGLSWIMGGLMLVTWAVVAYLTRYSSLSAMISAAVVCIYAFLFVPSLTWLPLSLLTICLLWRHKQNIVRLMQGKESKIGQKSSSLSVIHRKPAMRVLIVKLSSMGDLIHALPALTDARTAIPDIEFDWVIDESFYEIATWHASVKTVIKSAHRRWRSHVTKALFSGDIRCFYRRLREKKYDLIIDAQGNFKSAIITRLARGTRVGFDKASAAEEIARFAYHKAYPVKKAEHAVTRLRLLFACALGYAMPSCLPDFGILTDCLCPVPIALPARYLVFVHSASWDNKCWPESYWTSLIEQANAAEIPVLLPWGNENEKARAERLAANYSHVTVLPPLRLSELASLIGKACAVVCVDTGLAHLAGALNIPTIGLYGPTDGSLVGAIGEGQQHLQAAFPCAPCRRRVCHYTGPSDVFPACFTRLPPDLIWDKLKDQLL